MAASEASKEAILTRLQSDSHAGRKADFWQKLGVDLDSRQAQTACKMPPHRLQISKGLSPAPKGPGPKPVRPKRVKNAAKDSVRQAKFEAELAAWQVAHKEHAKLLKIAAKSKCVRFSTTNIASGHAMPESGDDVPRWASRRCYSHAPLASS